MPTTLPDKPLPPRRKKIRQRALRYKYGRIAVILFVLVGLSILDRAGLLLSKPGELEYYDQRIVRVSGVIDGDTIEIALADLREQTPTTRVRIWGIDCPEIAKPGRAGSGIAWRPAEPFGNAATEFTRQLADQKMVRIIIEPHRIRGRYGRLLAHLEILPDRVADGADSIAETPASFVEPTNLAAELLRAGLARSEARWYHSLLTYYQQLETTAKLRRVGQWE